MTTKIIEAIEPSDFFTLANIKPAVQSTALTALEQKLAAIDAETAELHALATPSAEEFYARFTEWNGNSDGSVGCD